MIHQQTLANGLTLIVERIDHAESVAYDCFIPGGIITDPPEFLGSGAMLAELTSRGAGGVGSRDFSDRFDAHGILHSESAAHDRFVYSGAMLATELPVALEQLACMLREPNLPENELESIRNGFLQELYALKDNPSRLAQIEMAKRYYPDPYSRSLYGSEQGLNATDSDTLKAQWLGRYGAKGALLSIAGKIDPESVERLVVKHLDDWVGTTDALPAFGRLPKAERFQLQHASEQTQILLAYPGACFGTPDYYTAKVANGVLSGGMFGRLFIEVREKRGLCYSIYSRHAATQNYGTTSVYAGTTPQRAEETQAVIVEVLRTYSSDLSEAELNRAKLTLLSNLIIAEESTGSRAFSNAVDWWFGKRIRTLEEIKAEIMRVSIEAIKAYCQHYPFEPYMLLTLGPSEIEVS